MSDSNSYLGIWLVFAWIIVPGVAGFVFWLREKRRRAPKWLIPSAKALLELDAKGVLVPHGIGGHARDIIAEFIALHAEE